MSSTTRAWALALALAAIVVALDQATKQLAAAEIASGAPVAIGHAVRASLERLR